MASFAVFWFDARFDELLALDRRGVNFTYHFTGNPSLKHLIEAMRIPHTEVGKVIANGNEVSLEYLVRDGDFIGVYPVLWLQPSNMDELDDTSITYQSRFVLDNHLGKLASYLRMLGFDALYSNDYQDDGLTKLASQEHRILLTRDRGLLMRRAVQYGYYVRSMDARQQIIEVLHRYNLFGQIQPFQRCMRCNGLLRPVDKAGILDRLEPLTQKYYQDFCICQQCDKIYWRGSHCGRMQSMIDMLKTQN